MSAKIHDKMTAWACANAVLSFLGLPDSLFGEWNEACKDQGTSGIDVKRAVHLIISWRVLSPAHEAYREELLAGLEQAAAWVRR